nr:hypothetical protein Iba_chr13eCG9380 [Ipomoea batatas]
MVLGPIFVGVRCPLREQGTRLWSSDRSLWEQGAHYGSKVPARSSNRSITTAVGKNATGASKVPTTGVRCPLGPRTDLLRRRSEKTQREQGKVPTTGLRCSLGPRTDLLRRRSEKTLRPKSRKKLHSLYRRGRIALVYFAL